MKHEARMEMDDKPPEDSDSPRRSGGLWFGRRKHITSREVTLTAGDIEKEMHSAAAGAIKPADVIDIPSLQNSAPPESIIDPTLFSVRQRRPGQNVAYRITQFLFLTAFILASVGIVNSLLGHRLRALVAAGLGMIFSGVGVLIVRRSRLAHRLRGYVAAAGVLSFIAIAFALMPPLFRIEAPTPAIDKKPATTNAVD